MIRWVKSTVVARAAGLHADPYYEWALTTGFRYYGSAKWLPVLIELKKGLTAQSFAEHVSERRRHDSDPNGWATQIRVPSFYETPPSPLLRKSTRFLAVLVGQQLLADIYKKGDPPAEWIERFELGRATATLDCASPEPDTPNLPDFTDHPLVVTGVIDDGISFAHDRFWRAWRKTRIEYFWDQSVPNNKMKCTWGYGREFTKRRSGTGYDDHSIDDLMEASTCVGLVDEDVVYRRSGFFDQTQPGHKPLAARNSHGAHVMDLACTGDPMKVPAPDRWPIVAVQLPVATVADTSGATLAPQVFNGLCYVSARAQAIASAAGLVALPVVVNVSFGLIAGPHDGSGLLEAAIDDFIQACSFQVRVILPAGNNFQSRCHARLSIAAGRQKEIAWRVLPDDWTESHVEIWLPLGTDTAKVTINVTAPDGTPSGAFVAGVTQDLFSGTQKVGQAEYRPPGDAGKRALVRLSLGPTGAPDGSVPLAPAGLWRITIDNANGSTRLRLIDAWIQRDDAAPGYLRRGRQSYFDDPAYQRYDSLGRPMEYDRPASYVKRKGSLNAIATGTKTIVIGGFRRSDNKPAPYTAAGPLKYSGYTGRGAPNPNGPEALFPSEDAPSLRGVLGAGTRSNSCTAMSGTSVSAPFAARFLVEEVLPLKGSLGGRNDVFKGAKGTPPPPSEQARCGGGRIDMPSTRLPRRET